MVKISLVGYQLIQLLSSKGLEVSTNPKKDRSTSKGIPLRKRSLPKESNAKIRRKIIVKTNVCESDFKACLFSQHIGYKCRIWMFERDTIFFMFKIYILEKYRKPSDKMSRCNFTCIVNVMPRGDIN